MFKFSDFKPRIVQFGKDSYGIRKGGLFDFLFGYSVYVDLVNTGFSWGKGSEYFRDCVRPLSVVTRRFEQIGAKEKVYTGDKEKTVFTMEQFVEAKNKVEERKVEPEEGNNTFN